MHKGQKKVSDREFLEAVSNGFQDTKELADSLGMKEASAASRAKRMREKIEAEKFGDSPKALLAIQKLRRFENVATSEKVNASMLDELFGDLDDVDTESVA